ncbi:Metallo-dependent phosphatase-like protein [Dactylonectria macrodidyma]|uniref:Metallo-dependent phosphatase-like protein n=1 Tax=Dactylonectria macrodidyma TaxID=307937 RepID=A0A9P9F687_9HYPO|nr:Metallo-dependent phosphatase-like protein [Dactylonectria macrodidyma]
MKHQEMAWLSVWQVGLLVIAFQDAKCVQPMNVNDLGGTRRHLSSQLQPMTSRTMQPLTRIELPGRRIRETATKLRAAHATGEKPSPPSNSLRLVCISDTHNTRPTLPLGDVLIHAGDLTENGSFAEVQAELKWLSDQPHTYKILIAGNHDVLMDDAFSTSTQSDGMASTKRNGIWNGGPSSISKIAASLWTFPSTRPALGRESDLRPRRLTIFGSPWTLRYGKSAFQYQTDDEIHWTTRFASLDTKPDIVVTHGPPKHHLDARGGRRVGCPYLAEAIARVQPRLVVFGHIHVSYGREDVVLDGVQRAYEEVMTGWGGWDAVVWMAILVLWAQLMGWILPFNFGKQSTTLVNAAVVSGPKNDLKNDPIVVEL